jgi:hypothetical protein
LFSSCRRAKERRDKSKKEWKIEINGYGEFGLWIELKKRDESTLSNAV